MNLNTDVISSQTVETDVNVLSEVNPTNTIAALAEDSTVISVDGNNIITWGKYCKIVNNYLYFPAEAIFLLLLIQNPDSVGWMVFL